MASITGSSCITGSATRIDGINASGGRVGGISAKCNRIGGISASASLICIINQGYYLYVKPEDIQWINEHVSVDYGIETNNDWLLE